MRVEAEASTRKKTKMDHAHHISTPSSSPSTISTTSTDQPTSSTNTNSILTNVSPTNNIRSYTNVVRCNPPSAKFITNEISQQARRYAETRHAFPPFVIKFQQDIEEKAIIQSILSHYTITYKVDIVLAGHRLKNKRDLFLFVENRVSFAILFDDDKWPTTIDSLNYVKIRPSHLPS